METFNQWILNQLEYRGWSQAELARRAGIADATLSRIIAGTRQTGPDAALAIARALGERPEKVFRLAGLLPPGPTEQQEVQIREIAEMLAGLPDGAIRNEAMAAIVAIARDAMERARERGREKVRT